MVYTKNNTPKINQKFGVNIETLKEELKENKQTSLGLIIIKKYHSELSNMDEKSFSELMSFRYDVSNLDELYREEVDNDFGYFVWKKLKEKEIKSLNSVGIPDNTLEQLVGNKIPVWELHLNQIKALIKNLSIDMKQFIKAVLNFDITILNMSYNTDLLARLDSSVMDSKNGKAELIEEGSYDLFLARQERKRERFLEECKNLLY